MTKRVLIINDEFTPTSEFIDEYIRTLDGLPNLLSNILSDYDADLDLKRVSLYTQYPYLEEMDEEESRVTLNLLKGGRKDEAEDYQIQLVLDFLDRYPQFAPLISGVESQTSSFIKEVLGSIRQSFVGDF